jgi:hypothetical protein
MWTRLLLVCALLLVGAISKKPLVSACRLGESRHGQDLQR